MDKRPLLYVMLSAALFGVSPPLAKLLVGDIPPLALAGFLYLGAFLGLLSFWAMGLLHRRTGMRRTAPLERGDVPWLAGAIFSGGMAAPILLMTGLTFVSGFTASLLMNLEGVATAMIAVLVFREYAGRRLWLALTFMTLAGVFLTWDPSVGEFYVGGLVLIVLAMICWGIDNNLTQRISSKDPTQIARLKGLIAGTTSLSLALLLGSKIPLGTSIFYAIVLGALSYGVSLVLFIKALEGLGSARTGAFFSLGPFVGAAVSIVVLGEQVMWTMVPATALMFLGVWVMITERHIHLHRHSRLTHTHVHERDMHHRHPHPQGEEGAHSHEHVHLPQTHSHVHWPDAHHSHEHEGRKN
jgi:drug/metabolite transporter (DMT)-like permease